MKTSCNTTESQWKLNRFIPHSFIMLGAVITLIIGLTMGRAAFSQGHHDHHDHGDHSHGDHKHGKESQKKQAARMPSSYGIAMLAIDDRLKNIQGLIDTNKLDDIHGEAEMIHDVAKTLAQLALKADSGVPREAVKEINLTAKALADKFKPIDEAGHSGNLEATKKIYQEMLAFQVTLKKHVPNMEKNK